MAVSDSYRDYVLDLLQAVVPVRARKMFGGLGLYAGDLFFALIDNDTLFFKVDDTTRPKFEARGMKPFQPFGEDTKPMRGYFELPEEVLEDREALWEWMRDAIGVAKHSPRKQIRRAVGPRTKATKASVKRG